MKSFELTLIITERCNLRCSYCFCDKTRGGEMTAKKAVEIITRTALENEESTICVLFFGGEPMLNFDCIRRSVAALETTPFAPRLRYKIVSNGTLLTAEIKRWLLENRSRVELAVSLDGDAATQELHRHGSFDRIDREFLRELRNVEIKMVTMPDTLESLADNAIGFAREGFSVQCELAEGVAWEEEHCTTYGRQLQRIIEFQLANPELYPTALLATAFDLIELPDEQITRCKPGVTSSAYDTDGNRYDCQRCTPYYNNGTWSIPAATPLASYRELTPGCPTCPARNLCNACPATIAVMQNAPEQAAIRCRMTKTALWAAANFVLRAASECPTHRYLQSKDARTRISLLRGAKRIWKELT